MLDSVNKTLYIPLYGKALVCRKGVILHDPKAEKIWAAEGFSLKGKSRSKWLAYYMGMRSAVFDRWVEEKMASYPDGVVLHLGCGMDSRVERVGTRGHLWFDVDFPEVIRERKRYYPESGEYHMVSSDIRDSRWIRALPKGGAAIVVMEGVSMYLQPEELQGVLETLSGHFSQVCLLLDCYTQFAARASKYKNPINDVGVTQVYGMDDPKALEEAGFYFVVERDMTPVDLIDQLQGFEKALFQRLYAGALARNMYRLYEYRKAPQP